MNSKMIKIRFIAILAALVAAFPIYAQNVPSMSVENIKAARDGSRFTVSMEIAPQAMKQSTNSRIEIAPVITSADGAKSVSFPMVAVAGRNMYYYTLRSGKLPYKLLRSGKGETLVYSESVAYELWMETSVLSLNGQETGCCGVPKKEENVPVARIDLRPRTFTPKFAYAVPVPVAEKRFNLSGRANVRFIVNRTDIDWSYANNYVELDSILATVNAVKKNPDAKVDSIFLKGFASPEGPYANNVRLAKGRTEVVKEYVRKNSDFPASIYHTSYEPEDWEGLREWLMDCSLPQKSAMIAFVDDRSVPIERKNDEFRRRFPEEYPFILTNVYPPLRHTDYRITYTVRKYLNVDEIREVMRTRPQNLSQDELFLLAKSYPQGSPEYDEVFDVAVRMFPESEVANLNAANSAMHRGDYTRAAAYLDRAGNTPMAVYGRGVLNALEGKYDVALPLFEDARRAGVNEAEAAIAEVHAACAIKNGIEYINNNNL